MNNHGSRKQFRFTGTHMLATMIVFFGVIVAVNFTMATLASRSWTGLVVKNSYVASQQFNQHLEQARQQEKLAWSSSVTYEDGVLEFILRDEDGGLLQPDRIRVLLGRPAFEQQDRRLDVVATDENKNVARIELNDGIWKLQFDAIANDASYRRDIRLLVRDGKGTLQ